MAYHLVYVWIFFFTTLHHKWVQKFHLGIIIKRSVTVKYAILVVGFQMIMSSVQTKQRLRILMAMFYSSFL